MPRRPARLRLQSLEDRTTPSTPPIRPGFVFDGPAFTDNSPGAFPPSPAIAVGPAHAVTVTAATIQWQALPSSKSAAGAPVKQPLKDFFVSAQGGTFASPRVIYDQVAGRFVIAVVETRASPTPTARIRLAVSDDANPNGTWHRFFIDADADDIAGADCAAYLGLAADEEAVYITATHHAFLDDTYQDARIYIVNKGVSGGWYAGQPAAFRRFDPDPVGPPADVFGIVPAQVHGPPPAGATGTYLVSYSGRPGLGTTEAATVIRIDNPLAPSPTFAAMQIELGDIDADTGQELPDAPQPGSPVAIDTGDRRIGNAVWLEDRLYFAATVKPPSGPDAGQATAHWFQVRTTDNVVERQGDIGGEGNSVGLHTFFPSVAVDELGNLAVTFAAANAETFLGSYYAARLFTESEMSSPVAMDNGPGFPYVRRPGNAGSASPWGAYSSTVVAPNGRVFWTFNAFPDFPDPDPPEGTDPGRWATRAGAFSFNWPSDPDDPSVLGPQTVVEDSEPLEIDLDSHFRDFETGGATTLTYSIIGNTNPALVATSFPSRNILRLTLAPNGAGVAVLTVRAQDAGTVEALPASTDDTFTLTVTPV
ncbi:MAG TPA: hypothetical protein VKD90_25385, partial [Gemmataceae bacterium]|nr:hypothetical protein [Gemmataceae bacterium]